MSARQRQPLVLVSDRGRCASIIPPVDHQVAQLNREAVSRMRLRAHFGGARALRARGHRAQLTAAAAAGFAIGAATMFTWSWLT